MSGRGVILTKDELRTLAKLIQRQEEQSIKTIQFRSERDRGDYLRCSLETHDEAVGLLDEQVKSLCNVTAKPADDDDPVIVEVVQKYMAYLEMAVGLGMQTSKNVHLRHKFLSNVRKHADGYVAKIQVLKESTLPKSEIEKQARELIVELDFHEKFMFNCLLTKADPFSQYFAKAIKLKAYSFDQLISMYQNKLWKEKGNKYSGSFESLKDDQKIEVYDEILKSSGRGTMLKNKAYTVASKVGKGLLIFTLGMSVWDIFSSQHKVQTFATEVAEFGAGYEGGILGEGGAAAIAGYLVADGVVAASALTASLVGLTIFVSGFGVGIFLGIMAGIAVTAIFETGGKHTGGVISLKKDEHKRPNRQTHDFHVYAALMPDGSLLARQIAYKGAPKAITISA